MEITTRCLLFAKLPLQFDVCQILFDALPNFNTNGMQAMQVRKYQKMQREKEHCQRPESSNNTGAQQAKKCKSRPPPPFVIDLPEVKCLQNCDE